MEEGGLPPTLADLGGGASGAGGQRLKWGAPRRGGRRCPPPPPAGGPRRPSPLGPPPPPLPPPPTGSDVASRPGQGSLPAPAPAPCCRSPGAALPAGRARDGSRRPRPRARSSTMDSQGRRVVVCDNGTGVSVALPRGAGGVGRSRGTWQRPGSGRSRRESSRPGWLQACKRVPVHACALVQARPCHEAFSQGNSGLGPALLPRPEGAEHP